MKVLLLHPDRDPAIGSGPGPGATDLVRDLGLDRLFAAMARRDDAILASARTCVLAPLAHPDEIVWRQHALADCTVDPNLTRDLYDLAGQTLEEHRKLNLWGVNRSPESLRYSSVQSLEMLLDRLVRLRRLMEERGAAMASPAWSRLRSMLVDELDDAYVKTVREHLGELGLGRGVFMSAQLGRANRGTAYLLHRSHQERWRDRVANRAQRGLSFSVATGDDNSLHALAQMQARGVNLAANVLAQSVDTVLSFFTALRDQVAFYVGCLNLRETLNAKGEPVCTPTVLPPGESGFRASGLYDPDLSLGLEGRAVGNDISARGRCLLIVTGANRGGKSTLLRSIGAAQLMLQSGMFVAATSFAAAPAPLVLSHFKREEGDDMSGGKLEEELGRMSEIVSRITPGCLLLCNEPFASTNEREGSDIGRQVFLPLAAAGVRVCVVTHLYDLAESIYRMGGDGTLFLRAPRQSGGRPFELVEGAPEPSAFGEDVYEKVFGERPASASQADRGRP
jgi:hypothetical protein